MMKNLYFEVTDNAMILNSLLGENGKSADIKDISRSVIVISQDYVFKQGISFLILMLLMLNIKLSS